MTTTAALRQVLTPEVLREQAIRVGACVRPVLTQVTDTATGEQTVVPIPCGSTRAKRCPSCADKNRRLRMQQCREGWHLEHEPSTGDASALEADPSDSDAEDHEADEDQDEPSRRVRSTRRRQDVPDLPRLPVQNRTIGRTFRAPSGKVYRPSMFITLTLPSYGPVRSDGTPVNPATYDYRRAALDALHFPKVADRWWQNLRRACGYNVQYFATVEAQRRLAPHLHAGVRGAIPRQLIRQVAAATYHQVWWPPHDQVIYPDHRLPEWDERTGGYVDQHTGVMLPTWDQALDALDANSDPQPVHVVRLGRQVDIQGIVAESGQADKRVGYLCKYLTKTIDETYGDDATPAQLAHMDRLHEQARWLPCSPGCWNWLRYGTQPEHAESGMVPGQCPKAAHDRANLGLGGRRVLVSRKWTGKTLTQHRADRAEVVRQVLDAAGVQMHDTNRWSTTATDDQGRPRYRWTTVDPDDLDLPTYRQVLTKAIGDRLAWRQQYDQAKTRAGPPGT
ncbi:MAG: replication initiator, partial [Micromonosporaceae bacterium]